ncbi:MAG: PspC protein [Sphingobacteriaceae bacterium]|jgi:phage shock protein PspC (stress-responsive transcriptional regulator)|nr:PspC protein [Sphingobacteriaceae bacterium]
MEKKLQRDENSKMIGGVAAGLAEYFDIDVTWVRLGFIIAVLAGLSGVLAYIILWIAVPAKLFNPFGNGTADYKVYDDPNYSQPFASAVNPGYTAYQQPVKRKGNGSLIAGTILIIMGFCFLLHQLDILPYWFSFHKLWPLALIIPGILILTKAGNSNRTAFNDAAEPAQPFAQAASEPTNTNTDSTIN